LKLNYSAHVNNKVRLQILGCGDAFGSGGRLNTCFYLQSSIGSYLIDCGATSLVALQRQGLNSSDVDGILISHLHGDHFGGIPFLLLDAFYIRQRTRPLYVITPEGGRERTEAAMKALFRGSTVKIFNELDLRWSTYIPGVRYYSNVHLCFESFAAIHSKDARPCALRINVDKKVISYSGDTEWTDSLIEVAENADLFICECNFFEKSVPGHLNYQTLMAHRDKLTCKRLLLTHLGEEMMANLDAVNEECAEEGQEIEL